MRMSEEKVINSNPKVDAMTFAQNFPDLAAQADAVATGKRNTRVSEAQEELLKSIENMHLLMREVGVRPATVINLWPIDIHSTGPITSNFTIPKCPLGQSWSKTVIGSYSTDVVTRTDGKQEVRPIPPIQIAKDILQQHSQNDGWIKGGLVIYMGDHEPNKKNLEDIEAARKSMLAHFRKLVNDANLEFARPDKSGRRNITDIHRIAAEYLLHYKILKERPQWTVETRDEGDVQVMCPACGAEPNKGAFQCKQCGWIVDPMKAYEVGAIDAKDVAMTRLTRDQLNVLGISKEIVPETLDERKARETGKRGPGRPPKVKDEE